MCWPGARPSAASRRERFRERGGRLGSSRALRALAAGRLDREVEPPARRRCPRSRWRRCRGRARTGRSGRAKAVSTCATVWRRAARGRAQERHLEAAVLLELVAVRGGQGLAHREADLLAAVVDALPLRGGPVAGEVGGEVGDGGLEVERSSRPICTSQARTTRTDRARDSPRRKRPEDLIEARIRGAEAGHSTRKYRR